MLTYFRNMSLKTSSCSCMIFSVAYRYWKSISIIERAISICIYIEFLVSHFSDLSCCVSKFTGWAMIEELSIRRRPRTSLISWGQKNACKILLCWLIVIWVLVCKNMYQYERHFGFFYCNPTILEKVSIASKLNGSREMGQHRESFLLKYNHREQF